MQSYAILPDGRKEWLLKINQWDFNWQSDYRYAKPVFLPKGSRLMMHFTYDNSSDNPRNPNQPPVRVKYGLQSTDEMGELWFQMLAGTEADFHTFQADYQKWIVKDVVAFNTLMIQQNPTNARAHVQLAKALHMQGKRDEAIEHFRRAVRLDPAEEEAHYHLGVVAMELNQVETAETEFLQTVRINPQNFRALNNLGLLLLHQQKFDQAAQQFRAALRINPEDPFVKENLKLLAESQRKSGNPAPLR
jgi:tetratricopeptide (TPR) repeat protein